MEVRTRVKLVALVGALTVVAVAGLLFRALWAGGPVPEGLPTPRPGGDGWVDLLDADHAAGWENVTDETDIFEIQDCVLHIFGNSVYPLRYAAYTAERFGDFDLHLEFRLESGANSGVFIRAQPDDPVYRGFEVQVLEDHGKPPSKNGSGAIYDVATPMFNMARPAGEWNSYDISVNGREVVVVMNGWMVVHTDLSKMTKPIGKFEIPFAELPLEGVLALQDHGGEAWYRNVLIRTSPAP